MVKPMPWLDLGLPGLFCLLILYEFSGLGVAPGRYSAIVRVSDANNNNNKQTKEDETMKRTTSITTTGRNGFTLVETLVVTAVIAVLASILLPAVQQLRTSAERMQCRNNLKQIGLAIHNFHDTMGLFPTAGDNGVSPSYQGTSSKTTETHNWPYHILPALEQVNIWDIGQIASQGLTLETRRENRKLLRQAVVSTFYCPSRREVRTYKGRAKSDYAANTGVRGSLRSAHVNNGVLTRNRTNTPVGIRNITDGSSNTLLVGETQLHLSFLDNKAPNAAKHWSDNESCYLAGGDTDVIRRGDETPALDISDKTVLPTETKWRFGSSHIAGMFGVLCDGSVRMFSYDIEENLFRNLCVRNDGNITTD